MKLVVFSDVHGEEGIINHILDANKDADYVISLGDSEVEQEFLVRNDIVMIKGNYRHDQGFVYEHDLVIDGIKIFMIHGHKHGVSHGLDKLAKFGITNGYDIILYGHTHIVDQRKIGGIQFLNPGSCARPRNTLPPTYMILEIENQEIKWIFKDSLSNSTIEV